MTLDQFPLKSKIAIVTGGTRGIGRAISLHLASLGASVLIVHSDPSRAATASSTVSELKAANSIVPDSSAASVCADLRDPASPRTIVNATLNAFNTDRIDILINNAAINDFTPTSKITAEKFDDVISVDFKGPLFLTQEVVKYMPSGGRIVNIGSVLAKNVMAEQLSPLYSASKAAMDSLTRTWAFEWGKSKGITVNCKCDPFSFKF